MEVYGLTKLRSKHRITSDATKLKLSKVQLGRHHTEETKAKISKALLGRHLSEETKAKMSLITKAQRIRTKGMPNSIDRTGTHHSEEAKVKMGKASKGNTFFKGKHHTQEAKDKLSQATKAQRIRSIGKANSIDRTGIHHSEETKAKMSKARLGKYPTEETRVKLSKSHKGRISGMLGKHHSKEAKAKLSKAISGVLSCHWLGGKSFEPYTEEFNEQLKCLIRIRDAYICQLCGIPERETFRKLTIHHIDYIKANSMPTNLISLCVACNAKVNKDREQWTAYFREMLNKRQTNSKALKVKQKIKGVGYGVIRAHSTWRSASEVNG